jgi:hypothetical protein
MAKQGRTVLPQGPGPSGGETEYAPSRLMDKAARDVGYNNAKEVFDKLEDTDEHH